MVQKEEALNCRELEVQLHNPFHFLKVEKVTMGLRLFATPCDSLIFMAATMKN
jgi:hypothetical protein